MEIVLQFISILLQNILNTYFMTYMAEQISKMKYHNYNKIIFFTSMVLSGILVRYLKDVHVILSIIIFGLTAFLNLILNLKLKLHISLLIEFVVFLIFSISETFITFILMSITNLSAENISLNYIYSFIFSLIHITFVTLTIVVIKYIVKYINNFEYIIKNVTPKTLLILLSVLAICVIPQLLIFAIYKYNYPSYFILINSIQMVFICLTLFLTMKKTVEKNKAESDLITTKLHNNTMAGMIDGVKTLKHDYNNIMQALNGYVSTKQYDKLQDHINKVLKECNIVNTLGLIDPEIFNDPAIYGIVGAKYFLITEHDITMDLEIVTNIKEINFPMPELSRIFGILLDNAYEATQKCDNPYVKLEMRFDNRKCADIIRIINTYDTNINIDLDNIYKKGVSSKKVKSGIGLWEVNKIISKFPHAQIYPTIEKDKFVQNIIIEKNI